jgi:gamma-tubulin complex component 2
MAAMSLSFYSLRNDFICLQAEADHMSQMMSGGDFESTIQNFDANFSRHLLDLLERLSHYSTTDCEHQMLNIIARLDHNGFYTAQLEKRAAEGKDVFIR